MTANDISEERLHGTGAQAPGAGAAAGLAERILQGVGVSPGVAIGTVFRYDSAEIPVAEQKIAKDRVEAEQIRFRDAVEAADQQIVKLQGKIGGMGGAAGEELGYLLDAYRQMLRGSRLVRGVERRIAEDRINAEGAVHREMAGIVADFSDMNDDYLASRVEDVREVGRRLLRSLTKVSHRPFAHLPKRAIVLADELSPADTALMAPLPVAGMATVLGGTASHTAIMARSLGMPAVVGLAGMVGEAMSGRPAVIDGTDGVVVVNPSPATLAHYRQKRARFLRGRRQLHRQSRVPAVTLDGALISLQANLELPAEIGAVIAAGAGGVGLLRSEFLYMNRADLPTEDEQYEILRELVERLDGRTLTVRTLDAGGDKVAPALGSWSGANPALGLRAIRLSMRFPELLDAQLGAILRAGAHGPVRILIPMVCSVNEIRMVRAQLDATVARLKRRRVAIATPLPPLGVMIEVPGAALAADALARHCDFFSIGTNDLVQYTLAIDRAEDAVAHLYDPLHPAVLRLIQFSAEAALRARLPVCVCGEIAGDPRYTALLLGLGVRDLSMAAAHIPVVKHRIREIDLLAATKRARVIMDQSDSARTAQLLDDFNDSLA